MTIAIAHDNVAGATYIGTISQREMAHLVRALGTYIADGPQANVRIDINGPRMHLTIGDGVSGATVDVTDSAVYVQ